MNDSCSHSTLNGSSEQLKIGVKNFYKQSSNKKRQKLSIKKTKFIKTEASPANHNNIENELSACANNEIYTERKFETFSLPMKRQMINESLKNDPSPTPSCCSLQLKKIRLSILDHKPTNCNSMKSKGKNNRNTLNNGLSKSYSFSSSSLSPKYHTINGISIRKKINLSPGNLKAKIIAPQIEAKSESLRFDTMDTKMSLQNNLPSNYKHFNYKSFNPNCVSIVQASKLIKKFAYDNRLTGNICENSKPEYSLFKDCTICINPIKISCLTPKVQSSTNDTPTKLATKHLINNSKKPKNSRKLPSVFHKSLPSDMIEVPKTLEEVANLKDEVIKDKSLQMSVKRTNGWAWIGDVIVKKSYLIGEVTINRHYYIGIMRSDQILYAHDNILMRPPYDKHEKPYVGKIASLWFDEVIDDSSRTEKSNNQVRDCKHMMMTVYWYYRPEHLETGRLPHVHGDNEILSSKHYDENSIACIIGKAYVLDYNAYCRYKATKKIIYETKDAKQRNSVSKMVPPASSESLDQYPPVSIDPSTVLFCRAGYNYFNGRIYSQTRSNAIYYTT